MKIKDVATLKSKETAVIEGVIVWVGEPTTLTSGTNNMTFTVTKFSVKDDTGSIYCSTSKQVPQKGTKVEVRGTVNEWKKRDGTLQKNLRVKELNIIQETKTESSRSNQMTKEDWQDKDRLIGRQAIVKAVCGMFEFNTPIADDSVEKFERQIIGIMEEISKKFLFKDNIPEKKNTPLKSESRASDEAQEALEGAEEPPIEASIGEEDEPF